MRNFVLIVFCACAVGLCSCKQKPPAAVHVFDCELTAKEIQDIIPPFDKEADSVEIKQEYIDAWILRQVMLHEAQEKLSKEEKNFDRQIREYKDNLLIDAYENKMLRQLLDTVISAEEIAVYQANSDSTGILDKELIMRSILQQRKMELLKTLRKEALNKAKGAGEVLVY